MAFVTGKDKYVQLTYTFMFSRKDNIWNNITEFEHDLDKFLISKGLEAEVVNVVTGGSGAHPLLFIRDVSKEMTLKNDKDVMKVRDMDKRKPESSYKTTRNLVKSVENAYKG